MSKFYYLRSTDSFEIWLYEPDILHAFPFRMERVRLPWRIRCIAEYFVGYCVYYIRKDDKWAGYCVISNGRNPRYAFSGDKDIIYGRYYIDESFRGHNLSVRMLQEVLNNCGIAYEKAFAYLRVSNTASVKVMEKIGAKALKRFDMKGLLRRLQDSADGEFVLYEYLKGSNPE